MISVEVIKFLERLANATILLGIILVLYLASLLQFILHDLPCPLCLLQRIGFTCIAFGFLLNFRFGFKPSHYSIILLSGLFTGFVALRQVALHVIPGTGFYGRPFLGLHLYTWSFIIAMLIVIATALLLGVDRQYLNAKHESRSWQFLTKVFFVLVTVIIAVNIISVIFECGFKTCPDNPVRYELLSE